MLWMNGGGSLGVGGESGGWGSAVSCELRENPAGSGGGRGKWKGTGFFFLVALLLCEKEEAYPPPFPGFYSTTTSSAGGGRGKYLLKETGTKRPGFFCECGVVWCERVKYTYALSKILGL